MPHYSVSPGDFVEIAIKGYVVYNAGGYIAITNSLDVVERCKQSDATFDRDKGEFYFDIPGWMIASVEEAHLYPDGTIARITPGPSEVTLVCEYLIGRKFAAHGRGETHWFQCNTGAPVVVDVHSKVRVIWNPEEDG